MRDFVLLGAGSSVEAGVPDAFGMTHKLIEVFARDPVLVKYSHVLRFVVGGLLFNQGVRGNDPFEGVNVEDVFNAIQILAERQTLEAAPFIGSWHPLIEELDVIRPLPRSFGRSFAESPGRSMQANRLANDLNRAVEDVLRGKRPFKKPGEIVAEMIRGPSTSGRLDPVSRFLAPEVKERPGEGEVFEETNEQMIRKLAELVWLDDASRVEYLQPLFLHEAAARMTVATLNYDNSFELAAGMTPGVTLTTGIDEWSQTGRFPDVNNGVYLLKLHGSIDWSLDDCSATPEKPVPHQIVKQVLADRIKQPGFRPAVVFGQRNKLTAKGPYLDLLRVFRDELSQADRLTVIGYSFRDEHVNEYLAQWLNGTPQREVRIINGEKFPDTEVEFAQRLIMLSSRVQVLRMCASKGIRECFWQTHLKPDT